MRTENYNSFKNIQILGKPMSKEKMNNIITYYAMIL